jgi:hypothetical protein
MTLDLLRKAVRDRYEVHEWKHACAVLKQDFPEQWNDVISILNRFKLRRSDVLAAGGGLSKISQWFNLAFKEKGWDVKAFQTKIVVDEKTIETPTHAVDCVKGRVALEIEWSNKDPFFDRDLNNFRLLSDLRAISVGIIITKSDELSEVFQKLGPEVWSKYGWSTTWMKKLLPRINGGGGGGCPVLVFGITKKVYANE